MSDKGFESLKALVNAVGKDIRNLYDTVFELQDRVAVLEAAEQVVAPDQGFKCPYCGVGLSPTDTLRDHECE